MDKDVIEKTQRMIDNIKSVCDDGGLNNTGDEYKVVTEVFLYKFLNDKFLYTLKKNSNDKFSEIEKRLSALSDDEYEDYLLNANISPDTAKLRPAHFISSLYNRRNENNFHEIFDNTLVDIANYNLGIFSVSTGSADKIKLFEPISTSVKDTTKRDDFCRSLLDKIIEFKFDEIFEEKYDFFSTIFEHLIGYYNKDSGSYGEYYTPNSIARIIAQLLVTKPVQNVSIYDPAAGSGTLLLGLAHVIGEDKCSIYSQDISQKSCEFLRLNLILNNLVHSLSNVVHGNTLTTPAHLNQKKDRIRQFDYIVSNPPFNSDFSKSRNELSGEMHAKRFFAGVPNIPSKDEQKKKMAIYLLFLQHILFSMNDFGKAAIVVPTGFLTAKSGIGLKIREKIVKDKMLRGVISMPSNIFANTGTNVSVMFLDKEKSDDKVILIDASKLGKKDKVDGLQRTFLEQSEQQYIIDTFQNMKDVDDFAKVVTFEELKQKKYSFSAGQYFDVKIEYIEIKPEEFQKKIKDSQKKLNELFNTGKYLEDEINAQLIKVKFD